MINLLWVVLAAITISLSRLPLHLGWLVFVGWIPLIHVLGKQQLKLRTAAAIFALIYIGVVFYWIASVTPGGLVGIGIIYFLFYLLAFYMIRRIGERFPGLRYFGFVLVMLSFEFLQNFGETRFPWFHNAYSLGDYTVLIQAADLGGTMLLSALILAINALLYRLIVAKKRCVMPVLLVFALWIGYGLIRLNTLPLTRHDAGIHVMQPSIPQDDKWENDQYQQIMQRYEMLCAKAAADSAELLIFPEAAIPVYLMYDWMSLSKLKGMVNKNNLDIFTGFPHFTPAPAGHVNDELYYNAAALFRKDGSVSQMYYKNILVPIGERMLWLDWFPFLWKLQFGQANWEFGTSPEWIKSGDYTFSPSICYELAFAGIHNEMAIPRDKKTGKLKKTDYLVNITNDAWFGTSYGPWLHGVMTKFRAVENRIQIYRSANTGISMIVDPLGKIQAKAGLFEIKNITAPLYLYPGIPLYRHIAWYPFIFVGLALGLFTLSLFGRKQGDEQ